MSSPFDNRSPFDDPDFRAELAAMGITHAPGTADRTLEQVKPLLAAEGIDLDNFDGDLDALNAALGRAMQRHNFELFTPVGDHRAMALGILRRYTEALDANDDAAADAALESARIDPDDAAPAISHVIGVSLGLLDTWHTDAKLGPSLGLVRVPRREGKEAQSVARDVLALAAKGRAFDSIEALHLRHSGLDIYFGGALAVAASLLTLVSRQRSSVSEVADALLPGARMVDDTASGAAFRRSPANEVRDRRLGARVDHEVIQAFTGWANQQADMDDDDVLSAIQGLGALRGLARSAALDPDDPADVDALLDAIYEFDARGELDDEYEDDSDEIIFWLLESLDVYLHYRLETADDPDAWAEAHDVLDDAMAQEGMIDPTPGSDVIEDAFAAAASVDPNERRAALGRLPIIAGVGELLSWLGTRRDATPTAGVRRADIERVAAMIGVAAVGVNRRRPAEPSGEPTLVDVAADPATHTPGTRYVMSMHELPELVAWWEALRLADLIDAQAGRVRPGPAAETWLADDEPPVDLAETVIGIFVAQIAGQVLERTPSISPEPTAALLAALLQSLSATHDVDLSGLTMASRAAAEAMLMHLEAAKLLDTSGPGRAIVPPALRGAVAKGTALAVATAARAQAG